MYEELNKLQEISFLLLSMCESTHTHTHTQIHTKPQIDLLEYLIMEMEERI